MGDAFLERILRVTVRRGSGPAEGGEDGGADAVERAGQRLAVYRPIHQKENGGDDYQVRVALLVLGESGAECVEERSTLGAVESSGFEDIEDFRIGDYLGAKPCLIQGLSHQHPALKSSVRPNKPEERSKVYPL